MNNASIWTHAGMRMMMLRRIHSWIGAFIAPSILFFSFTGGLQLFSLHEAHGAYTPPAVIEKLGKLHKDQVFEAAPPKPGAEAGDADHGAQAHDADHGHDHGAAAGEADHDKPEHGSKLATLLLKWVFEGVAIGLFTSTLIGIWMALTQSRDKRAIIVLLILGTIAPVLLTVL